MGKSKGSKKNKANTDKNGANTNKKGADSFKEDERDSFSSKADDVISDNKSKENLGSEDKSSNTDGCDGDSSGGDNGDFEPKNNEDEVKKNQGNSEENSDNINDKKTNLYEKINEVLPIITAFMPVILFVIKQAFASENESFYGIPMMYFSDVDLSSFLIFTFVSVIITLVVYYPMYKDWLKKVLSTEISDDIIEILILISFTLFIFCIYIGFSNLYIGYTKAVVIMFSIIMIFLVLCFFCKSINEIKSLPKFKMFGAFVGCYFLFYVVDLFIYESYIFTIIIFILSVLIAIQIVYFAFPENDKGKIEGRNQPEINNENYSAIYSEVSTFILISLIIIFVFNMNLFPELRREYEVINYNVNDNLVNSQNNNWNLLKKRVVITHYKDKLVVMDGIINGDELIILKPGYKIIDGTDLNLSSIIFKKASNYHKNNYKLNIKIPQEVKDYDTLSLDLKDDKILIYEYLIKPSQLLKEIQKKSSSLEEQNNEGYLNKFIFRAVGNGNINFYDVNVSVKDSNRRLNDDEYRLIKTDKGFSLSLTKTGINVLNENQDGIKIAYKAKLDSDIKDLDRNIIATSFDYGFNNEITRTNKYGKSKDGKIDLSVSWDGLSDGDKNINSIFVLQEKTSRDWVDLSYFATDSVKDSHYIFDGLDDNKLYRILPIISESFDSDCVRFQDGEAEIVNIKSDEDFIKNKVYIQEFDIMHDYNKKIDNKEPVNKVSKSSVKTGVGGFYWCGYV